MERSSDPSTYANHFCPEGPACTTAARSSPRYVATRRSAFAKGADAVEDPWGSNPWRGALGMSKLSGPPASFEPTDIVDVFWWCLSIGARTALAAAGIDSGSAFVNLNGPDVLSPEAGSEFAVNLCSGKIDF